jgi:hypothetical protein
MLVCLAPNCEIGAERAVIFELFSRVYWGNLDLESYAGEDEISALYTSGIAPRDGLVAEYLFSPNIATDTEGGHQGTINGAIWVSRQV